MEITINGEKCDYTGVPTLGELLRFLGVDPRKVAVERNLQIVAKGLIEAEPVESGDSFEIIRLVGGG